MILVLAPLSYLLRAKGLLPGVWKRRGEALPSPVSDLERRRPVWAALSELYLDTVLDEGDNERIGAVLRASGYSTAQLEEILYRELHPLLRANALSVAGAWAGFDSAWLESQILQRGPRRLPFAIIAGKGLVHDAWAALEATLGGASR